MEGFLGMGISPFLKDFPEVASLTARVIYCTIYKAASGQHGRNYMGGMSQPLYLK